MTISAGAPGRSEPRFKFQSLAGNSAHASHDVGQVEVPVSLQSEHEWQGEFESGQTKRCLGECPAFFVN